MFKRIIIFFVFILFSISIYAQDYTEFYRLEIPAEGDREWRDVYVNTMTSIDVAIHNLSNDAAWIDDGSVVILKNYLHKVGIGTSTPDVALDVEVSGAPAATIGASNCSATEDYTIAMGYGTTASGSYSTAMGYDTTASGFYSTAMGCNTTASGTYSIAMGCNTTASGYRSTAMGYGTTASGFYSTAIGREIEAEGDYSVAIGLDDMDGLAVSQANTMAIMGGKVGIETTTPRVNLDVIGNAIIAGCLSVDDILTVSGDVTVSENFLTVQGNGTNVAKIILKNTDPSYDADMEMRFYKGEATLETGGGATLLRFEPYAEVNVNFFGLASTGENREVRIFGRNSQDTATNRLILKWGDGTYDGGIISTNDGDIKISPATDTPEIYNSAGDLKIMPDVQGDVVLFGDTDVGDNEAGKKLRIYRRAAEGDRYFDLYVNEYQSSKMSSSGTIEFNSSEHIYFFPSDYVVFGRSWSSGQNDEIRHYGYITAASGNKYIQWKVDDADDYFHLSRQDTNILGFKVDMPLIVSDGSGELAEIGRGTTDTDITYIALRNADGTKCYIYPDAAGTGIVVSTTKP